MGNVYKIAFLAVAATVAALALFFIAAGAVVVALGRALR